MSPLEKHISKKNVDSVKSGRLSESQKGIERNQRLQKKLEGFRTFQKEKYEKRKKEVIAKAISEVKAGDAFEKGNFDKDQRKFLNEKNHLSRLRNYQETMSEQRDIGVRDFAYAEIADFQFYQENFRGEGSWLEEYNQTDVKDRQTLEEFVLEKQYLELDKIRLTLVEARVGDIVPKLYKDLDGEENILERQKKTKEVNNSVKSFLSDNRRAIDGLIKGADENVNVSKDDIFKKFKDNVFPDIDEKQISEMVIVHELFDNLITDYSAMMDQKDYVKALNPEMVAALMQDGITEKEWNDRLTKRALEQAKKLANEAVKRPQDETVPGTPVKPNFDTLYFSGEISTAEKMGHGSRITFESTGVPGEYLVKFPSDSGHQYAYLTVREVTADGKKQEVYIFKDPLMDNTAMVGEKAFRSQVNGLFLDHVMNESFKHGSDYLGPGLNDVLRDQEMSNLAEQVFYPKKLNKDVLVAADVLVFRNLMKVLTNKTNNVEGEGIYGNLQAIRTRISLLHFAFSLDGGNKAKIFYKILSKIQPDKLKTISIEGLCELAGVEGNAGNFGKH